jgi:hypothetical protein
VTGLDLQATASDPALGASGLALATDSARALLDLLDVCRAAFSLAGGEKGAEALQRLVAACLTNRRVKLTWATDASLFDAGAVRAVLLLGQVAATGLGAGDTADFAASRLADRWRIQVTGGGPRAHLPAEAIDSLAGQVAEGSVAGRWAPGRFLHAVTATAGGSVVVETSTTGFCITVTLPVSGG